MKISRETLHQLVENKLCQAGLRCEHAATTAGVLIYADTRGVHSHGAMRVEYYAERISKGDTSREPEFRLEETGPRSAILHANNATGQVTARVGVEHAIETTQQKDIAVVDISRMGHGGAISYFVQQAVHTGLIGVPLYQSDPMVVSFGGAGVYYGIDPLVLAVPGEGDEILAFDMAATVQTWGKALGAHSRNMSILDIWAVDKNGAPTTDPFAVHALLPAAESKGYDLMMMISVLSGVLLGLSFGRQVSSMYNDLHAGRNLGQLYMIINPNFFSSSELFRQHLSQTMHELNTVTPAPGFNQVYYPGQDQDIKQHEATIEGTGIVNDIHQYLISDTLYNTSYETRNPFA